MMNIAKILFPMLLVFGLIIVGSGEITAPVDIIVLRGTSSIGNASVWVDGQYKGVTDEWGHFYIQDLDLGYHTVNAQYEDYYGKYLGSSGFDNEPGKTIAKVYLQPR
jgi:hypothetical protein